MFEVRNLFFRMVMLLLLTEAFSACTNEWNQYSILPLKPVEYLPEGTIESEDAFVFGRALFFDKRLSRDSSVSCAVCHKPFLAFSDGLDFSDGVFDRKSKRNSPSIVNMRYSPVFMFDANISTLEMQALSPVQDHNEMDMTMKEIMERIQKDSLYITLSQKVYGKKVEPYTITRALAAYQRKLVSLNSPFDQYYYGKNPKAISLDAKKGFLLFKDKFNCVSCHPLPMFTNYKPENNGLSVINGDYGRYRSTGDSSDFGKFKVPSLRNIGITSPYMHDGRFKTLEEVIQHYREGGEATKYKSELIKPLKISTQEEKQLIKFLESLQDLDYFVNF